MNSGEAHRIVKQARRSGMKVNDIAARLGCSRDTLHRWEREDCEVHRSIAMQLEALRGDLKKGAG